MDARAQGIGRERTVRRDPALAAAGVVALVAAATLIGAWIFQYGFGLPPCPLCLEQRIPYYIAIPLAAVLAFAANAKAPRALIVGGLVALALTLLVGAGLGAYHAGVEWHWWPGPQDCSGPVTSLGKAGNLLQQMQTTRVIRCDEAAWRFLGLSLAGYNVIISLALAGIALWGAVTTMRRMRG